MTGPARAILARRGAEMTRIRDGETLAMRGFLQQLAPAGGREVPTDLGQADLRRWQLIAPAEVLPGDRIRALGAEFLAEECRPVRAGAEVSHWEAVLRREGNA